MAATKKTKKASNKAEKPKRSRAKKAVNEDASLVVDEFLNESDEPTSKDLKKREKSETRVSEKDPLVEVIDERITERLYDIAEKEKNPFDDVNERMLDVIDESEEEKTKSPEEEITEIIYNQIAYEEDKAALDAILKENNEEESAPNVEEIINDEAQKVEETKPQYGPIKKKKRLTNRDVFGYDFMGVIYE